MSQMQAAAASARPCVPHPIQRSGGLTRAPDELLMLGKGTPLRVWLQQVGRKCLYLFLFLFIVRFKGWLRIWASKSPAQRIARPRVWANYS